VLDFWLDSRWERKKDRNFPREIHSESLLGRLLASVLVPQWDQLWVQLLEHQLEHPLGQLLE